VASLWQQNTSKHSSGNINLGEQEINPEEMFITGRLGGVLSNELIRRSTHRRDVNVVALAGDLMGS
jgi:hypothetical protein